MFFALKHIYYDSYHLGNTFKSPFYPVNPEVTFQFSALMA